MTATQSITIAALDIGGANIKGVRSDGRTLCRPFALWKTPELLRDNLERVLRHLLPFDRLVVTMTGELCDCYSSLTAGVRHILEAVVGAANTVAPRVAVSVWSLEGEFVEVNQAFARPRTVAAGNWLALATWAATLAPEDNGILIDIGSTTTDFIVLQRGKPVPVGFTDTERLQSGELVYHGVGRTPVFALVRDVIHRDRRCRVATENFATTLDVYLLLDDLPEGSFSDYTADGREADRDRAMARLARVVCADPESFTEHEALELARQAAEAHTDLLLAALRQVKDATATECRFAIVSGSGEFLARRIATAAGISRILELNARVGTESSEAACAYALTQIAADH